jgi:type II secretory pathway pseudopilin PulG
MVRRNDAAQARQAERQLHTAVQRFQRAVIRTLCDAGEEIVNKCRNAGKPHHYRDQTGNLRSSTGYILLIDGRVVSMSDFTAVSGPKGDGKDGVKEGKQYAKDISKRHRTGIALIVVAGMNYAEYVEKRGWDVLVSGKLHAERIVPSMLRQLASLQHGQ